jgi:hypothetical protein
MSDQAHWDKVGLARYTKMRNAWPCTLDEECLARHTGMRNVWPGTLG